MPLFTSPLLLTRSARAAKTNSQSAERNPPLSGTEGVFLSLISVPISVTWPRMLCGHQINCLLLHLLLILLDATVNH